MISIDKELSELQRQILAFSCTDKSNNIEQVKEKHQKIISDIKNIIKKSSMYNGGDSGQLQNILDAVVNLEDKIDNLQTQHKFREEIIYVQLDGVFIDLNKDLEELFNFNADHDDDPAVVENLWMLRNDVMNVNILSGRYFYKHESAIKSKVLLSLNAAQDRVKILDGLTNNQINKEKIPSILDKIVQAKNIFAQAVQADRNYSFLINVVLAGETAEISVLSDTLRIEYLGRLQAVITSTDQQVNYLQQIAIVSSLIGTIFAIAIALQISRNIRKPLQSITTTFSQLAKGENLSEIPGAERSDEIGRLANAADIFRQTNVRTQQLLVQTEDFSLKLQQRETDLKLAVQKAEAANLAKSQFLANMSHELRTPMNAILGMLSLLQKTGLNPKQAGYTEKTSSAAKLLLSILNDILDLSKAEAGKMDLYQIDFNLDHVIDDITGILSTYIGNKPVELLFDIGDDVPRYLFGDPLRLQQILINLGGNAIKFTERGSVLISIHQQAMTPDKVKLDFKIQDTGIGIAPEHQQKIFSGFTQAEGSITRRFGGTGLGLAISKTLVELMGGQLSLQSNVGIGSLFSFSIDIPLLSDSKIEAFKLNQRLDTKADGCARLKGLHILLVEDNLINQQIAVEVLEAEGAKISVANNGQEALDFLQQNLEPDRTAIVDVILMDLQMPVMDGITATQKIRTDLQLSTVPIIAMTANAMASDRDACLRAGMNEHVGKPFDVQHLVNVISQHCGKSPSYPSQAAAQVNSSPAIHAPQPQIDSNDAAIDLDGAIARMGGNQSLYMKVLPQFRKQLSELPARLQALAAVDDIATIARELHSFKGSSAMMGANALSKDIAGIEKQLKQNPPPPNALQLVDRACELITQSTQGFTAVAVKFGVAHD
jgi:signal transduction histidine kinase/DNA-binding response OmpR family regulator